VGGGGMARYENRDHDGANGGAAIPLIPPWARRWAVAFLITAVIVLIAALQVDTVYGDSKGGEVLGASAAIALTAWWLDYTCRRQKAEARRDRALYEKSVLTEIDIMKGAVFEEYCCNLLWVFGYQNVVRTGSIKGGDQGGDITATDPTGREVVVQCKRQKASVGPGVVRELLGAINSGRHEGRIGIVMTNAPVTAGARTLAREKEIEIIDRAILRQRIGRARFSIEQRQALGISPAVKHAMEAFGVAVVIASGVILQIATSVPSTASTQGSPPIGPTRSTSSVTPSPDLVVREFFAAINRHDWQEVWQLGGKNLGKGPHASYDGMIYGYRFTAKDVVTSLSFSGNAVSGRILAYETNGLVQTYSFTYLVHGTVITSGRQMLLGTSGSAGAA
jgi:HJR/Mrr/RecB family endonuclease